MSIWKDFMSKITLNNIEGIDLKEVEQVVEEVNSKETEIANLKTQLDNQKNEYEALKSRVIDKLFNNPTGTAEQTSAQVITKDEQSESPKTFKDIIDPQYYHK